MFVEKLRQHLGTDPQVLPIVAEAFTAPDHPNVHKAIETWLAEPGPAAEVVGVAAERPWGHVGLTSLLNAHAMMGGPATIGPVQRINLPVSNDEVTSCVQLGLFFIRDGEHRLVLLLHGTHEGYQKGVRVEATQRDPSTIGFGVPSRSTISPTSGRRPWVSSKRCVVVSIGSRTAERVFSSRLQVASVSRF